MKRKDGNPQGITRVRTERTQLTESGYVSCIYERTKTNTNQTPLDGIPRVRVKEKNICFLFFLHELIKLPKQVRICSLPHSCTVDKLNHEQYKYMQKIERWRRVYA